MADTFPSADVAVVLVTDPRGAALLADYNSSWRCFTLPMTKVGLLPPTTPGAAGAPEPPPAAAARAAAEVLGHPVATTTLVKLDVDVLPWNQGMRDGTWKRYRYHVFATRTAADPKPLPGHVAVWLTPAEFAAHEPVSPTARHILAAVSLAEVRRAVGV